MAELRKTEWEKREPRKAPHLTLETRPLDEAVKKIREIKSLTELAHYISPQPDSLNEEFWKHVAASVTERNVSEDEKKIQLASRTPEEFEKRLDAFVESQIEKNSEVARIYALKVYREVAKLAALAEKARKGEVSQSEAASLMKKRFKALLEMHSENYTNVLEGGNTNSTLYFYDPEDEEKLVKPVEGFTAVGTEVDSSGKQISPKKILPLHLDRQDSFIAATTRAALESKAKDSGQVFYLKDFRTHLKVKPPHAWPEALNVLTYKQFHRVFKVKTRDGKEVFMGIAQYSSVPLHGGGKPREVRPLSEKIQVAHEVFAQALKLAAQTLSSEQLAKVFPAAAKK